MRGATISWRSSRIRVRCAGLLVWRRRYRTSVGTATSRARPEDGGRLAARPERVRRDGEGIRRNGNLGHPGLLDLAGERGLFTLGVEESRGFDLVWREGAL